MLNPNPDIKNTMIAQAFYAPRKTRKSIITNAVSSVFLSFLCRAITATGKRIPISVFRFTIKKLLILSIVLLFASIPYGSANDFNLPDLGSPSDAALSKVKEAEIRQEIVNQIYGYDLVMLDPIIFDYIEKLGFKLAAHSENPKAPFDFFIVNENVVNASTYPGGLIIIFSGLFLKSDTESELAGVVAHEIAHATQRHASRFYANAKKSTIPVFLGLIGAILASRYSSSPDAPVAIATATTALQQQSMINFTRAHEYEADRVGIETLKRANFNPLGMAAFFEKLMRENPVDERYRLPEFLRTHPLSVNRVSEAKNRAQNDNSGSFQESDLYPFVKERIRIFTKNVEIDDVGYYRKLFNDKQKNEITNAEIYGYALALNLARKSKQALEVLDTIEVSNQTALVISLLRANIWSEIDMHKGKKQFEKLYDFYPESPIVIEPYIQMLTRSKSFKNNKKARSLARRLVQLYPEKPNYYQLLAVANQNLGRSVEANEALAMKEHHINNNYRAVRILKNILKDDLDYYQRARIESKITEYENLITDRERRREILEEQAGRAGRRG
jgi:predicted Zn-dependent protease